MNKNKKNQAIAVTVAASLLVGGTLAWQSFSQAALNESAGIDGDVGARLHNDFNGSNADVYVENYASENGTTVYTRVRLHEYMEYGEGAGVLTTEGRDDSGLTLVEGGMSTGDTVSIDKPLTWDIHMFGQEESKISEYVSVNYGDVKNANGSRKIYMPTFNKDMDSDLADIKGELLGTLANDGDYGNRREDEFSDDAVPTSTYVEYTVGETLTGTATYSTFSEMAAQNGGNTEIEELHTAQYTVTSPASVKTVMSMEEWEESGKLTGNFWVYDIDGWVYWANGLVPQTATSLLVDSISVNKEADEDYHYGLHVEMQAFSSGDWVENLDEELSDETLELWTKAAGLVALEDVVTGTTDTVQYDGVNYYVLTRETKDIYTENGTFVESKDAALLWAANDVFLPASVTQNEILYTGAPTYTYFHNRETESALWDGSYMQDIVLPTWLDENPTLQSMALCVKVETGNLYLNSDEFLTTGTDIETTYDNVFLLSQPEFLEHVGLGDSRAVSASYYFLRSRVYENTIRAVHRNGTEFSGGGNYTSISGVRPAIWIAID